MAKGKRVPDQIRRMVFELWDTDRTATAEKIHRELKQQISRPKDLPSQRYVAGVLKGLRSKQADFPEFFEEEPPLKPWGPGWPQDPEEIACLFRLLYASRPDIQPVLTESVARWALKLRCVVTGPSKIYDDLDLDEILLSMAEEYSEVERAHKVLGIEPLDTGELDALLIYRFWESPAHERELNEAQDRGEAPTERPEGVQAVIDKFPTLRRPKQLFARKGDEA